MSPDIIELYDTVPLGVMRADIWRYSILYVNGGIYADWDVTNLTPIQKWLPLRNHRINFRIRERRWDFSPATMENKVGDVDYLDLQWSDCDLLVGVEGLWQFSNWVSHLSPIKSNSNNHGDTHQRTNDIFIIFSADHCVNTATPCP